MLLLSEYFSSEGPRTAQLHKNTNNQTYYVFYYTHPERLDYVKGFADLDLAEDSCDSWVS